MKQDEEALLFKQCLVENNFDSDKAFEDLEIIKDMLKIQDVSQMLNIFARKGRKSKAHKSFLETLDKRLELAV